MKYFLNLILLVVLLTFTTGGVYAQVLPDSPATTSTTSASTSATTTKNSATATAAELIELNKAIAQAAKDTTKPEDLSQKVAILSSFKNRPVDSPTVLNFLAYWVQAAVTAGIPANTIYLILLTPILAMLVSFVRIVVGLPTLDMLVPIALSFAFAAVGVEIGMFVLGAVLAASYFSKVMLSKVQMMFYPKRSLSMLFFSLFVFAALTIALGLGYDRIVNVSIFPILILMLIGDSIVSIQLRKSAFDTITITGTTLMLGLLGYGMATSTVLQNTLILYPELILISVIFNIVIGRYFGLRVLEYFRFSNIND